MQNNAACKMFMLIPYPLSKKATYFPFSASHTVKPRCSEMGLSLAAHKLPPPLSLPMPDAIYIPPRHTPPSPSPSQWEREKRGTGVCALSLGPLLPADPAISQGISFCALVCHGTDKQVRKDDGKTLILQDKCPLLGLRKF